MTSKYESCHLESFDKDSEPVKKFRSWFESLTTNGNVIHKFGYLAVRPEALEGRPLIFFTGSQDKLRERSFLNASLLISRKVTERRVSAAGVLAINTTGGIGWNAKL